MKSLISSYLNKFLDSVKRLASSCFSKLSDYVKSLDSSKRIIMLAAALILVLLLVFGLSRCSASDTPPAEVLTCTVTMDNLDVHKKSDDNSRVLSQLPADLEVEILEQKTVDGITWGRIDDMKLADGTKIKAGWIDLQCVRFPGEEEPVEENQEPDAEAEPTPVAATMGTITASKLNIRKGPDDKYETNGAYYKGDRVEILETQTTDGTTWGQTNLGWIGMGYVKMDGSALAEGEEVHPNLVTNGDTTILGYGVVDLGELYVRLGPGTEHEKVGTVKKGDRYAYYQTSSTSGSWVRIENGWVSTEYFYLEGTVADDAVTGTVTTDDLNIRTGPNTSFRSTGTFMQGDIIDVLAQVDGWGYTQQGWVFMNYVEPNEPTFSTGTVTVTRGLNVRKEPNADSEIEATLVEGNIVTVLEVDGSWGRIVNGWINLNFVEYESIE